jgi:hypothetical protein
MVAMSTLYWLDTSDDDAEIDTPATVSGSGVINITAGMVVSGSRQSNSPAHLQHREHFGRQRRQRHGPPVRCGAHNPQVL